MEKGHLSNVQAALSLARALVFGVASDAMAQQAMYEQMVFPTRFVWGYGGKQVRAPSTSNGRAENGEEGVR